MSGIQRLYSAGTVDQWPKNVSSALLFGGMWTFPIPDLDRTDYLLVLGANPHASQGSLLAAPDLLGRLDAIRARGGKVVVVDPRRTGTAERADEWVPIRPGTDAALLLAVAQVLFAEDRVRPGRLAAFTNGIDEVGELCREFTPEAVAETCGVPAETIRAIARELADAPRAAVYGRIGTCNQEFGTLASWLVDVVNVLTGNLDRDGGAMFANPIAWSLAKLTPPEFANGFEFGRWRSRVRGAPEVLGQVPISCLAEEIATPGAGQIKALITIAGNPVISAPDAAKLDAALPELECMISVDNWLNETTRHAHVILPGASVARAAALRRDDLVVGGAQRGQVLGGDLRDRARARARVGDPALLAAILQGHKAADVNVEAVDNCSSRASPLRSRRTRSRRSRDAIRARSSRRRARPAPSACSTSRSGSGRGAIAYGENPDGLTLAKVAAAAERHRHGPARAAPARPAQDAVGQDRARAALHHRATSRACASASRAATRASCW